MNIDINPSKTVVSWGGGLADTLGVALLSKQYGANNLNILHISKDPSVCGLSSQKQELAERLQIDLSKAVLSYTQRESLPLIDNRHQFKHTINRSISSLVRYVIDNGFTTLVNFMDEGSETSVGQIEHLATQSLYTIMEMYPEGSSEAKETALYASMSEVVKTPFHDAKLDRNDIIEMYYQHDLHDLLPLTRSCSLKIGRSSVAEDFVMSYDDIENNVHCGACSKCMKRKYTFKCSNVIDPTKYIT